MTATVERADLGTERNQQLRDAVIVVVGLAVLGAVLGLVWAAWSPARPPGVELSAGTVQLNESESFAGADIRFVLITGVVGLLAGLLMWFRRDSRGPLVALALCVGGLAGAGLTALVGHIAGGGTNSGPPNTEIPHLALSVHLTGFYLFEALLASLVYSLLVAFAVADDLGRPDPVRDRMRPPPPQLIQPQYVVQYPWTDGDRPSLPQQDQFPPQDPSQGT